MSSIRLRGIEKEIDGTAILNGIDLDVEDGECVVLLGASGCGKSTLLRIIAGLDAPTRGSVEIDGKDVTQTAPRERQLAMVFQNYALYPHMTVEENLGFALRLTEAPAVEVTRRVQAVAATLEITPLLSRLPKQLSGGQRQRVAIGRAVVREPQILLFDEPLSNLDAQLRAQMRLELKTLHHRLRRTTLYVTHDQVEAMSLADRICVMRNGKIEQFGEPRSVYDAPASVFVANFVGQPAMNFVSAELRDRALWVDGEVWCPCASAGAGSVLVGWRPPELDLSESGSGPLVAIEAVEEFGASCLVHALVGKQRLRIESATAPRAEAKLRLGFSRARTHLFNPTTEQAL